MKNILIIITVIMLVLSLSSCGGETVTLYCDGENCENTVKMKVTENSHPDESWIIFCEDCAENVLED